MDATAFARGYKYDALWSNSSLGWQGGSAEEIVQRVVAQAQPGAIIALHLGVAEDAYALQEIIDGLRNMGYKFATVPDLISQQAG